MELAGISFTTTLPAPMTEFLPMVTPGRIVEPPPIHTPSSKDRSGNCVADGRSGMCPFRHPFRKVNGMSCGIYFHIGGYHHVVTDNDIVIIEERTVHVHDHLVPEIDVFPILASEVYVDVNILADTSEHLPIDALLCLIVGIIRFSELV